VVNLRKLVSLKIFALCCVISLRLVAQQGGTSIGVVIPKDLARGEQASGSVVLNPGSYTNIPGVRVITAGAPAQAGGAGPALNHYQIELNGLIHAADYPFVFTTGDFLGLRLKAEGGPEIQPININLAPAPGSTWSQPSQFTAPPIAQAGSLQIIHGPFSGDSSQTSVNINGSEARVIAESPRALFYLIPDNIPPGPAEVDLKERQQRCRLKIWVIGLQMSADRLQLKRGESTAFHVKITGADTIPKEAWSGAGEVPELVDISTVRKFLPDFKPPASSQPGILLLIIENKTPGVVSMSNGDHIALTFSQASKSFEYHGSLHSKQTGGFGVDGVLIPFLHELPCQNAGPGNTVEVASNTGDDNAGKNRGEGQNSGTGGDKGGSTSTSGEGKPGQPGQSTTPSQGNTPGSSTTNGPNTGQTDNGKSGTGTTSGGGSTGKNPPSTSGNPNTPTTPENPNTPTTPGQPEIPKTPSTPTPTGTPTNDKNEQKDCPQRGKGCVALIIDFSNDYSFEFDMSTIAEKFTKAGCDTDYVTPKFKTIPKESTFSTPTAEEVKAAQDHNQAEWDAINAAIERHRQKVAKGVEIAIELTNGHGGESAAGLPCGDVEPADWFGSYVRRDDFHLGNYKAANKNVCSWFTADLTCYGGLTPKVVDELENLTTATCNKASAIACGNHAGWEADGSMSSATSTETCNNGNVWWQSSYVKDALDAEIKRRDAGQKADYSAFIQQLHSKTVESTTARYTDRGYAKDHPPMHARGGYGEKSSGTE
jgi:hypothetical protein